MDAACINYKDTGYFSQTITEYLEDAPQLRPFYAYRPDTNGFTELLKNKKEREKTTCTTRNLTKPNKDDAISCG